MQTVLEKRETKIIDWTIDFINYFRKLGFLSEYRNISTDYIVRLLMQWNNETFYLFKDLSIISDLCEFYEDSFLEEEQNGKIITPAYELNLLALLDQKRIWWNEREIKSEGNFSTEFGDSGTEISYTKVFSRLAEISRGAFLPENIRERAGHIRDLIYIDFKLNGKQYRVHARSDSNNGSIDLNILNAINHIIAGNGFSFKSFAVNDEYNSVYIISLTEAEKQKIDKERGWDFSFV